MFYSIIKSDVFNKLKESFAFSFNNKYSANIFHGIMLDTKAIKVFIVKEPQV